MEVTFPLTAEDYWQFRHFVTRRTAALKWASLVRIVFLPLVLALEFSALRLSWPIFFLLLAGLTAAWVVYLGWAVRKATLRAAQVRTGSLGLHTVRIEAAGLRQQNTVMESFVRWEKIIEIVPGPHHIAFFMGPSYAFIVPLGALRADGQADVFLEAARAYWLSARDGTAPLLPQGASWPPPPQRMGY